MYLENHQFTFKETEFIETKAILSHIWHPVVGLDTPFRCPVKKAEASIDLYPIGLAILGLIQNAQREFCSFRSRIKLEK